MAVAEQEGQKFADNLADLTTQLGDLQRVVRDLAPVSCDRDTLRKQLSHVEVSDQFPVNVSRDHDSSLLKAESHFCVA